MNIFFKYKKIRLALFLFLITSIVIYPLMLAKPKVVNATSSLGALQQQYNDLQNLINQNQQKIQQNNNNISNLQAQINSYQQLIFQKQVLVNNEKAQIDQLDSQINALNAQIASEESQISVIKGKIDQNAKSGYEETYIPPVTMFMGNSNINSAIESVVYYKATMTHENDLVIKMDSLISSLNANKSSLVLKQNDAQSLYNQEVSTEDSLIADQNALKNEQSQFQSSNNSLQSSNSQIQQQQQSILQKIASLELSEGTPGVIPANVPCNAGFYYSQECPSWGGYVLDSSGDTYSNAGCSLIAAIMAENLIGNTGFNPYSAVSYWTGNGGTEFGSLPGVQQLIYNPSISEIDAYASPSSPVVIGFYVPDNPFGTHFVTMTGAVGASGTMQDPWFGPNLTFGQNMGGGLRYDSSNIFFAAVF